MLFTIVFAFKKYYFSAIFFPAYHFAYGKPRPTIAAAERKLHTMTEGELCSLAEDAYDLTEIAREALQAVLSEKGISVQLRLERPSSRSPRAKPPEDDLVFLTWPTSAEEASYAINTLAAAGIPSFLSLEVREEDLKRAYAVLHRDDDDDAKDRKECAILCPNCHSAKIVLEGRDSKLSDPPSTARFQWSCDACGNQWVDDGIAQEVAGGQSWPGEEFPAPSEEWDPK
jgi:DNA-directed RNA polymerase subunit M/transcription elongation factor TFIIS